MGVLPGPQENSGATFDGKDAKRDTPTTLRTVPTFVTTLRSAHLEILEFPMGGAIELNEYTH